MVLMSDQENENPAESNYWDSLYQEGSTPWDLGEAPPAFVALLEGSDAPAPGRLISIGAGRGNDARLFAAHGFDVLGIDFAPTAVDEATRLAEEHGLRSNLHFEQRDMFNLPAEYIGAFDYVLEHTCLSAIGPTRYAEYARVVADLLKPGGLFIALFFNHGRPGGPPFTISADEVRSLFAELLQIEHLAAPEQQHPQRSGPELFGLLRKPA